MTIAGLREELGLTQLEFGERIGLASKAQVSLVERGLAPCSLRVALRIEQLSGGRIDAGELSEEVRISRHGIDDSSTAHSLSPDVPAQNIDMAGEWS